MQTGHARPVNDDASAATSNGAAAGFDAGDVRTKLRRSSRFIADHRDQGARRDWGRYAMIVYGFLAIVMGGFAFFAVTADPGRPRVVANRPAPTLVPGHP